MVCHNSSLLEPLITVCVPHACTQYVLLVAIESIAELSNYVIRTADSKRGWSAALWLDACICDTLSPLEGTLPGCFPAGQLWYGVS
jgi:hypothetical protein